MTSSLFIIPTAIIIAAYVSTNIALPLNEATKPVSDRLGQLSHLEDSHLPSDDSIRLGNKKLFEFIGADSIDKQESSLQPQNNLEASANFADMKKETDPVAVISLSGISNNVASELTNESLPTKDTQRMMKNETISSLKRDTSINGNNSRSSINITIPIYINNGKGTPFALSIGSQEISKTDGEGNHIGEMYAKRNL